MRAVASYSMMAMSSLITLGLVQIDESSRPPTITVPVPGLCKHVPGWKAHAFEGSRCMQLAYNCKDRDVCNSRTTACNSFLPSFCVLQLKGGGEQVDVASSGVQGKGKASAVTAGGGITERIKAIEEEIFRTQKNKATEGHLGLLKAKLAKLRSQRDTVVAGVKGEGFECSRHGHARVCLLGFPSVGKSSLFSLLTNATSAVAAYEFTTLTCIPGIIHYRQCQIQLLDLPGIIGGAAMGVGRGRQVIAVARSADVMLMVLDATRPDAHRAALEQELGACGVRLNQDPPDIYLKKKKTGGLKITPTVPLTKTDVETVKKILSEYKVHNADVVIRQDVTIDQVIDVLEGNRVYTKCIFCYNKIDIVSMEEVQVLWRRPYSTVTSCSLKLNLDVLMEELWNALQLVRVYTRKPGESPSFEQPLVMTNRRGGTTVRNLLHTLHHDLIRDFKHAIVWGRSCVHSPQRVGLAHRLADSDVVQIVKKTLNEVARSKQGRALTKQGLIVDQPTSNP